VVIAVCALVARGISLPNTRKRKRRLLLNRMVGCRLRSALAKRARRVALVGLALVSASCGSDSPGLVTQQQVGEITVDVPSGSTFERGTRVKFNATVSDIHHQVISVPVVWASSAEQVATFDANGVLTAVDTGTAQVVASSLGVSSQPITVTVVWNGAAALATFNWTQPNAATPGAIVSDSIRVIVTNIHGVPVGGARVSFSLTAGGGALSSATVTSSGNGIASTQWTLGPQAGANSLSATVVDTSGQALSFVSNNPVKLTVKSYAALSAVAGNQQSGQILADLPVAPSVKLVDSLGKPRPGVPITFAPTGGGRVAVPTVSTGADGVASPGTWTLGDASGVQNLVARVESATLKLSATGTGTAVHYSPVRIALGGFSTCGLDGVGMATCMGQEPQIGGGDTINKSTPTAVGAAVSLQTIAGGASHFCGVANDKSIYCWGLNALVDTSGKKAGLAAVPTQLPSALAWSQVVTGASHTCALTTSQDAYCWGSNQSGQLGTRGDTTTVFVPTIVSGGFKFSSITSGVNHACALTLSHDALCWGSNQSGQLGDGTTTNRVSPTLVAGGLSFQAIGGGDPWTCGLTTDGRAFCWGSVQGVGNVSTPHSYDTAPVFVSLAVGSGHACALAGDGSAYCWGNNQFGQLGDSTNVNRTDPTPVTGGLKFKSIAAGVAHTCGIVTDGSVACWGSNLTGELGDKSSASRSVPRFVILGVNP
jgi:alpha-tubulin suppressor-like RCC1 family protein